MILNFPGYINRNTKLDLNFKDYSGFMENYYKNLTGIDIDSIEPSGA